MTSHLDLDDFVETAAELPALPEETVVKMARLDLAEPALHAPQAGWGDIEFYPDVAMKAAENLEAVEAEVAGWIAARLRPGRSAVD